MVRAFASKILRKPIRLIKPDGLSDSDFEKIKKFCEDVDGKGTTLQNFAFDVLTTVINYHAGLVEIIFPENPAKNMAEEEALGLRPTWSLYKPDSILELSEERVRLLQRIIRRDGEFGEAIEEQVLVYYSDGFWQLWRADGEEKDWLVVDSGRVSIGIMPVTVISCDSNQYDLKAPPMLEVAYLNLRHYQVSADIDHACHIASVPRLFIFGADPDELGDIGAIDEGICLPRAEARVDWVSATLESFGPNNTRLEQLEAQMLKLGIGAFSLEKNVGESAAAKRLDRSLGDSQLGVLSQSLQNGLNTCIKQTCQYLGISPAPTIEVNRDFDTMQMDPQMLTALTGVANAGLLSTETFLSLLKQGELGLPDDWEPSEEISKIKDAIAADTTPPEINNGLT
jgi:hypothetical protein